MNRPMLNDQWIDKPELVIYDFWIGSLTNVVYRLMGLLFIGFWGCFLSVFGGCFLGLFGVYCTRITIITLTMPSCTLFSVPGQEGGGVKC